MLGVVQAHIAAADKAHFGKTHKLNTQVMAVCISPVSAALPLQACRAHHSAAVSPRRTRRSLSALLSRSSPPATSAMNAVRRSTSSPRPSRPTRRSLTSWGPRPRSAAANPTRAAESAARFATAPSSRGPLECLSTRKASRCSPRSRDIGVKIQRSNLDARPRLQTAGEVRCRSGWQVVGQAG